MSREAIQEISEKVYGRRTISSPTIEYKLRDLADVFSLLATEND